MIRSAVPADAPALAALHGAAFDRGWSVAEMAALLAQGTVKGFVEEQGEEAVGFLLLRLAADEAEILTLAVTPARRRQGIAHALLHHGIASLPALAIRTLFLEVSEDNAAAQRLYLRSGFTVDGRRKAYYLRPDHTRADAVLMRLPL